MSSAGGDDRSGDGDVGVGGVGEKSRPVSSSSPPAAAAAAARSAARSRLRGQQRQRRGGGRSRDDDDDHDAADQHAATPTIIRATRSAEEITSSSSQQQQRIHHHRIYSVPTTDTYGDESTLLAYRPYEERSYRATVEGGGGGTGGGVEGVGSSLLQMTSSSSGTSGRQHSQHQHSPAAQQVQHQQHPPTAATIQKVVGATSRFPPYSPAPPPSADPKHQQQQYQQYQQYQQQNISISTNRYDTPVRSNVTATAATTKPASSSSDAPQRHHPTATTSRTTTQSSPSRSNNSDRQQQQQQQQQRSAVGGRRVRNTAAAANNKSGVGVGARRRQKLKQKKRREFQVPEDFARASAQEVSLERRSAFARRPAVSAAEWRRIAEAEASAAAGASSSPNTSNAAATKGDDDEDRNNDDNNSSMSPSLQHLELMHAFQAMASVRQVQFSPSCGIDSDLLYYRGNDDDDDDGNGGDFLVLDGDDVGDEKEQRQQQQQPGGVGKRDGRYRSIDPVKATMSELGGSGTPLPQLSNRKSRLPTRADVGFPNATPDEIEAKQVEIRSEAAWEERSPRLIVLVTSDDLGRAVVVVPAAASDDDGGGGSRRCDDDDEQQQLRMGDSHDSRSVGGRGGSAGGRRGVDGGGGGSADGTADSGRRRRNLLRKRHDSWNGGGLDGMPYCGREVLRAKARNARHFGHSPSFTKPASLLRPNPYSVLAPPLDAVYSPSKGWRPRPFHDRPAGRRYGLACPTSVTGIGAAEPLVCSLALYALPLTARQERNSAAGTATKTASSSSSSSTTPRGKKAFGKMSEEFWFPAGDWEGKVQLDAARAEDGTLDPDVVESWMKRKRKAIFSYDPLVLVDGKESLFVVLQIYKLAHQARSVETTDSSGTKSNQPSTEEDIRTCSDRVFQQFGTNLLAPLCFGVSNFFPSDNEEQEKQTMSWPQGHTRQVQLFAYPSKPDTQEAFVNRLAAVARHFISATSHAQPENLQQPTDDKSTVSDAAVSTAPSETSKRRRGVSRIFGAIAPKHHQQAHPAALSHQLPQEMLLIKGEATIFVSSLAADFLQPMMTNGLETERSSIDSKIPKTLVDVSGDLAVVVLDQSPPPSSTGSPSRKRSNLVRLPISQSPSGYVGASEFREVQYLPARIEKHYDVDTELSHRSLLNLLYMYPHLLLRLNDDAAVSLDTLRFTIRVRVLQSRTAINKESGVAETSIVRLSAFHNVSPWAGPALLDEMYTKTFGDLSTTDSEKPRLDLGIGIPIKDEIKVRLPDVLDGTCSLHVSLFIVEPSDKSLALRPVSEALIPLSSPSSRKFNPARVATIIPNGNHRLKLGSFQLQLETRLVSSVHVGDPAVGTFLRDYPYWHPSGAMLANWIDSLGDFGRFFADVLSEASASTVVLHFDMMMYLHLCNLVGLHERGASRVSGMIANFMMANMQSLFFLFQKVKEKFLKGSAENGQERLQKFLKTHLDVIDERFLSPKSTPLHKQSDSTDADTDGVEILHDRSASDSISDDFVAGDVFDESKHGGAIRIRRKSNQPSQHELRVSRIASTLDSSGVPLSRVAYGASKLDRMRVEAELQKEGAHFVHFFDDDETIATLATAPTLPTSVVDVRTVGSEPEVLRVAGIASRPDEFVDIPSDQSITRVSPASAYPSDTTRPSSSAEFAQRFRTAAQVMLAPCVGPSLSNILTKSNSPDTAPGKGKKLDDGLKLNDPADISKTDTAKKVSLCCAVQARCCNHKNCINILVSFRVPYFNAYLAQISKMMSCSTIKAH